MMKISSYGLVVGTAIAVLGLAIVTISEVQAGAFYVNGHGGGAVVRTGPALRYYAPTATSVKQTQHQQRHRQSLS